jgi:hypothetical protein
MSDIHETLESQVATGPFHAMDRAKDSINELVILCALRFQRKQITLNFLETVKTLENEILKEFLINAVRHDDRFFLSMDPAVMNSEIA